jgi:hypothetical protein
MVLDSTKEVMTTTATSLASQPLALALVIINVLFLVAAGYLVKTAANGAEAWRDSLTALIKDCRGAP